LAVSSADWGQELAQAQAEFSKQNKTLNAGYGELKKTMPSVIFARVEHDQGGWVG